MPLFCTLASAYTGENTPTPTTFENRGYPLMFETSKKHMFFVDPGDNKSTKTVHKFYGAPLSVVHSYWSVRNRMELFTNEFYEEPFGYLPGSMRNDIATATLEHESEFSVISEIKVNDHAINAKYATLKLPRETTLSLGSTPSSTVSPSHGGNFSVINSIKVSNHKITPQYKTVWLPNETKLSIGTASLLNYISAKHGESFTVIGDLDVSNHTITPINSVINLPESYLYATCKASMKYNSILHKFYWVVYGAYINMKNESKNVLLQQGNNISITCGTEYNTESNNILIGNEVGNTITISATNTHSANHTFSASASSNVGTITLNNTDSSGDNSTSFTITGTNGINVTASSTNINISSPYNASVKTQKTNSTTYLSGKLTTSDEIGWEYVNDRVYMKNGVLYSKDERTLTVTSAGVVEVGKYIDFHSANFGTNDSQDYCCRLQDDSTSARIIKLPNNAGTLPVSNHHTSNSANILVTDIRVVTSLPSNAASYPNTLFLVTGGGVTPQPTYNPSTTPEVRPSVNIVINTGVKSITVNGTNYTTSTIKQFPLGTTITWSATAQSGYNITLPSSGSFENIITDITISPTANKNLVINPDPTFYPPSNKCSHASPSRKTCYYANDPDAKAKIICDTNCGANNYVTV